VAPGTCGTLLGVLLHGIVILFFSEPWRWPVLGLLLLLICLAGLMTAPWAMQHWRRVDPQAFVLDEVAGYLVVPVVFAQGSPVEIMVWGFALFRLFDILKLPPARQIDRSLHGPWGIMLDDLVAGIQAGAVMYGLWAVGVL
jgi:phosphatidylglycerophosphatase A